MFGLASTGQGVLRKKFNGLFTMGKVLLKSMFKKYLTIVIFILILFFLMAIIIMINNNDNHENQYKSSDNQANQYIKKLLNAEDDILLSEIFDFEWDTAIFPNSLFEKEIEKLMGKHFELKSIDESLYHGIIFFNNNELVYEFYYPESLKFYFGWYDYAIKQDDCFFELTLENNIRIYKHVKK